LIALLKAVCCKTDLQEDTGSATHTDDSVLSGQ